MTITSHLSGELRQKGIRNCKQPVYFNAAVLAPHLSVRVVEGDTGWQYKQRVGRVLINWIS